MRIRAEASDPQIKKKNLNLCVHFVLRIQVSNRIGKLSKKIDQTILQSVKENNGKKGNSIVNYSFT